MKKLKSVICIMFCFLLMSSLLLIGCSSGNSDSNNNNKNNVEDVSSHVEITLHGPSGESKVIGTDIGDDINTPVEFYKSNYYLDGYYDSPEGGKQYINKEGNSLSVWQENYPTDLYAQFKAVSSDLKFEQKDLFEVPILIGASTRYYSYKLPKALVNAAKANLQLEVELNLSFRVKDHWETADTIFVVVDSDQSSRETYFKIEFHEQPLEYEIRTISAKFPARALKNGYLWLGFGRNNNYDGYIKDLSFSMNYTGNVLA